MFSVFTKLPDGELLLVASRDELGQALRLARDFNDYWPREYVVRDALGNRAGSVGPDRETVRGAFSARHAFDRRQRSQ